MDLVVHCRKRLEGSSLVEEPKRHIPRNGRRNEAEKGMEKRVWYSFYGKLLDYDFLKEAFRKVKSANGAPGIDRQSCKDSAFVLDKEIPSLSMIYTNSKSVQQVGCNSYLPGMRIPLRRWMVESGKKSPPFFSNYALRFLCFKFLSVP